MDFKTIKEFNEFVDSCRKKGVKSVKIGELSIELAQEALFPKTPYQLKKELKDNEKAVEIASAQSLAEQERAMFWSSDVVNHEN